MPHEDCQEVCNEHSGMTSKNNVIIWLLGILIAISVSGGGYLLSAVGEIREKISVAPVQFQQLTKSDEEIKVEIRDIKTRLQVVELRAVRK